MIGIGNNPRRARLAAVIACALLLFIFAAMAWTAWLGKSATFDEPLHFMGAWIQTHYDDFRCNPEDPPLWKYYVAVGTDKSELKLEQQGFLWKDMLAEIPTPAVHYVSKVMYQTDGNDADGLLRRGRARMLLLGVVLGAVIAWWAWRLGGPVAGVVATAAFAFDPNFLAHAPLIKNDVPITLIFLLLMAAIWLLGERATLLRCGSIMLLVGVALTTKFSGVLAIPLLGIALVCRVFISKPWPFLKWTLSTFWMRAAAAGGVLIGSIAIGYVIIWACYGFRFAPTSDPAVQFDFYDAQRDAAENEMLLKQDPVPVAASTAEKQKLVSQWKPSATVRFVKSANKHHWLPQPWLFGFLYTYATSLLRRTYLCGEIGVTGWWYYFPLAMIFKTPLATLAGILFSLLFGLWNRKTLIPFASRLNGNAWSVCVFVVAPVFYMAVAMHSHLNIGLRHVLPVYPYLFIFLGVMAAAAFRLRPKSTGAIVGILALGLFVETGAAYPNYIPFFNVAFGGSRGGLALLSDSNIDWGQDLPSLAQWQHDHPDRQLYLSQFALPDPRYYKIHYIQMEGSPLPQPDQTTPTNQPPVFALSAVVLQGTYMSEEKRQEFSDHFVKQKPSDVIGGSIYLYDLPK